MSPWNPFAVWFAKNPREFSAKQYRDARHKWHFYHQRAEIAQGQAELNRAIAKMFRDRMELYAPMTCDSEDLETPPQT